MKLTMKSLLMLLIFFLSLNNYKSNCQSWQNKWFSMETPGNWRKPTIDYNNYPPIQFKGTSVKLYKDVRFTPPNENGGTVVVETFVDDKAKLIYKDFIQKDSITTNESLIMLNNMVCLKREAILKVLDKKKILNFYCTIWYIQGNRRVYIINYGSYNKVNYEKNLSSVEKCITSFKEK